MVLFAALAEAAPDKRRIEALYRTHGHLALRRARTILGNDRDADDAVQQIFVNLLISPELFEARRTPSSFVYCVTTNHCLAMLRHRGTPWRIVAPRPSATTDDADNADNADNANDADDADADDADDADALHRALATIRPELAEVAVYFFFDALKQEEIADVMDVSPRRVADLLATLRETLARRLAPGTTTDGER